MRTTLFSIAALSALALLATACSQDSSLSADGAPSTERALLQLAAVDVEQEAAPAATRAATPYPQDKEIGFYVIAGNGYKERKNIMGTFDATLGLWKPVDDIWLVGKEANILVYAPYDAISTVTLQSGKYSITDASACAYARYKVSSVSNRGTVTLGFVYARLVFTVSRHANYDIPATVGDLTVSGTGIYATAKFNPLSDNLISDEIPGTVTYAPDAVTTLDQPATTATYDLQMIPATLQSDVQVDITVDGHTMRVAIPKAKFASSKFETGKQYNVNLKLRPGRLDLTSVSVEKWGTLPSVSGGNGEFTQEP